MHSVMHSISTALVCIQYFFLVSPSLSGPGEFRLTWVDSIILLILHVRRFWNYVFNPPFSSLLPPCWMIPYDCTFKESLYSTYLIWLTQISNRPHLWWRFEALLDNREKIGLPTATCRKGLPWRRAASDTHSRPTPGCALWTGPPTHTR